MSFAPDPPVTRRNAVHLLWIRERLAEISSVGHRPPGIDRQILALAVPALGALVAEPLFVLVDSAVVGHLGTAPLAGLALASTVLMTVIGLCVFLAYATTAAVARRLGSGDRTGALQVGVDGMWLALGLGIVLAAVTWLSAPWLIEALGASDEVAQQAVTYLRWSAPGLPGMLLVLASTGALRGLLDTRTPLVVAAAGAVVNAVLNVVLVYGVGMGIAGSGLGTALTQLAMAVALTVVVVRGARGSGAQLRPAAGGIWANARAGTPLFVRTLSLRLAILLTVWVATGSGGGRARRAPGGQRRLGARRVRARRPRHRRPGPRRPRPGRRRRPPRPRGPAADPPVGSRGRRRARARSSAGSRGSTSRSSRPPTTSAQAAVAALVVAAVTMPMAGWVFVLDGVLIGAGDGRFLAWAGMATLVVYVPFALAVREAAPPGAAGLAWLWAAFAGVFMLARAVTTGWRARGTAWMVTGA